MTSDPALVSATWNMEWKLAHSPEAKLMLERLAACAPHLVCYTEAYQDIDAGPGHLIASEADYGYPLTEGRRKVMLWSREPWEQIDSSGHAGLPPGRFVSGRTMTPLGHVTVVGVCVPWRDAHVRSGRRDRESWGEHLDYLAALAELLPSLTGPVLLMGDFNQRIPRRYTPPAVHDALLTILDGRFTVSTSGLIAPLGQHAIDHISCSSDFSVEHVRGLSNLGPAGERLSDHFGVAVTLARQPGECPKLDMDFSANP